MSRTESETLSKAIEAVKVLPEAKQEHLIGYYEGRAEGYKEGYAAGYAAGRADVLRELRLAEQAG